MAKCYTAAKIRKMQETWRRELEMPKRRPPEHSKHWETQHTLGTTLVCYGCGEDVGPLDLDDLPCPDCMYGRPEVVSCHHCGLDAMCEPED